jgi:(p)ppGpp synthase/HD superfamily hydrolase
MKTNWSQEIYITTYRFAAEAHAGQLVPGTKLPYIMHPSFVCMEIIAALENEDVQEKNLAVQCALLHDVIEDTNVTYEQLLAAFGKNVADGVQALSKDKTLEKSQQMDDCLTRIRSQTPEIWMVKMADRITNLQPPPSFWTADRIKQYRNEAIKIHATLKNASPFLATRLAEKIDRYGTV